MSTKSEKFIQERKEYWEKLGNIIIKINKNNYKSLSVEEFQEFPNLYRKTCTDSETAKTMQLSPDTVEYINNLVLQSHNILYSSPKKTFQKLKIFFIHDFPQSFLKNIIPILIIFFLFFGVSIITFITLYLNPQYAKYVLPEELINFMKSAYKDNVERDIYSNIKMAGFYISNNISIAFASFVLGITFGIGTIYLVFYNSIKPMDES